MAIGTGAFDIAQDITENGIKRTIINDDLFTALDRDDATKQLASVHNNNVVPFDNTEGAEELKALTVGGTTFDYTGGENEANLITLYATGETIPQIQVPRQDQSDGPRKIVRRVQPSTTNQEPIVSRDLIDAIVQFKNGVPLPENPKPTPITPLETGVPITPITPLPISSTGLISIAELYPERVDTGIPLGLDSLLKQYLDPADTPIDTPIEGLITKVEGLPTFEIPDLPNIEGLNIAHDIIELRREQVRDLQPVDVSALRAGNINVLQASFPNQ